MAFQKPKHVGDNCLYTPSLMILSLKMAFQKPKHVADNCLYTPSLIDIQPEDGFSKAETCC